MRGVTVIIPTIGRPTLTATLTSIAPQLNPEDAVVVVSEGGNPHVRELTQRMARLYPATDWMYTVEYGGAWGHPNRNTALDNYVYTSHVWTIDDDDIATPTAMASLRTHLDDPWVLFRMRFGPGHFANGLTIWQQQRLIVGDIGTPMIFAPVSDARFSNQYTGDYHYALQLHEIYGDPVWSEDVVAVIRPVTVDE